MNCRECGNRLELIDSKVGRIVKTAIGICHTCCTRTTLLTLPVSSTKYSFTRGQGAKAMMIFYDDVMKSRPEMIPIGKKIFEFKK